MDEESRRLDQARTDGVPWRKWGPYLSERQWGTVREDYSESGDAWSYFSHDQARSRAYRWGEDGTRRRLRRSAAALLRARPVERRGSDPEGALVRADQQRRQPRRGRQGVLLLSRLDADALVHEVPVQVSAARVSVRRSGHDQPRRAAGKAFEYELVDTGIFDDDRYFDVFVEYAKASPEDLLIQITAHNRGPSAGHAARAADALVPPDVDGARRSPAPGPERRQRRAPDHHGVSSRTRRDASLRGGRGGTAVHRQRDERGARCSARRTTRRTSRTASTSTSSTAGGSA